MEERTHSSPTTHRHNSPGMRETKGVVGIKMVMAGPSEQQTTKQQGLIES